MIRNVIRKNTATRRAPAAMSPTTFEKPITWMSTGELSTTIATCDAARAAASNFWRTRVSISSATAMKSRRLPVAGSNSISSALTIAPEKSFATSRPTMPALRMLRRTASSPFGVGSKSSGITLPAAMPSSTTSV